MNEVTDELLVDGVKQFEEAMTHLLDGIEERRRPRSLASPRPASVR